MSIIPFAKPQRDTARDQLIALLEEREWRYHEETPGLFRLGFGFEAGSCTSFAHLKSEERFTFASLFEPRVPSNRRVAVSELVIRLNSTLFLGHFDLDLDDGVIMYRTTTDSGGCGLTREILAIQIDANLVTVNKHYGDFMRALYSVDAPLSAVVPRAL
jgi:hypothetical protein